MIKLKKYLQIVLTFLAFLMLVGCVSTQYLERKQYLFEKKDYMQKVNRGGAKCTVYFDHVDSLAPFDQLDFLYLTKNGRYIVDYYNGFLVAPTEQLESILRNYFKTSGKFNLDITDATMAHRRLQVTLIELYADYHDPNFPKAVIALQFHLSKHDGDRSVVLLDKVVRADVPLERKDTNSLLKAWNIGVERILNQSIVLINSRVSC